MLTDAIIKFIVCFGITAFTVVGIEDCEIKDIFLLKTKSAGAADLNVFNWPFAPELVVNPSPLDRELIDGSIKYVFDGVSGEEFALVSVLHGQKDKNGEINGLFFTSPKTRVGFYSGNKKIQTERKAPYAINGDTKAKIKSYLFPICEEQLITISTSLDKKFKTICDTVTVSITLNIDNKCPADTTSGPDLEFDPPIKNFGFIGTMSPTKHKVTLLNKSGEDTVVVQKLKVIKMIGDQPLDNVSITFGGEKYQSTGRSDTLEFILVDPIAINSKDSEELTISIYSSVEGDYVYKIAAYSIDSTTIPESTHLMEFIVHAGHPYLHTVGVVPIYNIDWDGDGTEIIKLDGSGSHTHSPGSTLDEYYWYGDSTSGLNCNEEICYHSFPVGSHMVSHKIVDNETPPEELEEVIAFTVSSPDTIQGLIATEYRTGIVGLTLSNSNTTTKAIAAQRLQSSSFASTARITPSVFPITIKFTLDLDNIDSTDVLELKTSGSEGGGGVGGNSCKVLFPLTGKEYNSGDDDVVVTVNGPVEGTVEAACNLNDNSDFPMQLLLNGNVMTAGEMFHSELDPEATINDIFPDTVDSSQGSAVTVQGFGFDGKDIYFGDIKINDAKLDKTENIFIFQSPSIDSGVYDIQVKSSSSSNLDSNTIQITVESEGALQPNFNKKTLSLSGKGGKPTSGVHDPIHGVMIFGTNNPNGDFCHFRTNDDYNQEFGPLYCTSVLKDKYDVGDVQGNKSSFAIMGLNMNPWDDNTSGTTVYVSWGTIFANGGSKVTTNVPYPGGVSRMFLPLNSNTWEEQYLIKNLPVSNHDHGVNQLIFDQNGDMIVSVGGNTNAGCIDSSLGSLSESPLSAAFVRVKLSKPDFEPTEVIYIDDKTGEIDMDARNGNNVYVKNYGEFFDLYAVGYRNAFGITFAMSGRIYSSDNGPNKNFGDASTSLNGCDPDEPSAKDELNLIFPYKGGAAKNQENKTGWHYGHPNLAHHRCKPSCPGCNDGDKEQCVYKAGIDLGGNSYGESKDFFLQTLYAAPSAQGGIVEYTANTFNRAMKGELLMQKYKSSLNRVKLDNDGTTFDGVVGTVPGSVSALNVHVTAGGVIIQEDYMSSAIHFLIPNDPAANGNTMVVFDVTPWRGVSGNVFVIGGNNFGSETEISSVTVFFGKIKVEEIVYVSDKFIKGIIPEVEVATKKLVPVLVEINGVGTQNISQAFRFLPQPGSEAEAYGVPSKKFG